MGRFGQAEARRARRFCLSVQYRNRHRVHSEVESELEATFRESLNQMLVHMDVISITCPHIPLQHSTYYQNANSSNRKLTLSIPAEAKLSTNTRWLTCWQKAR